MQAEPMTPAEFFKMKSNPVVRAALLMEAKKMEAPMYCVGCRMEVKTSSWDTHKTTEKHMNHNIKPKIAVKQTSFLTEFQQLYKKYHK